MFVDGTYLLHHDPFRFTLTSEQNVRWPHFLMTMFFNNSFYIASHGAPINCFFRTFFLFIQNFYLSSRFLWSKIHFGVSKECATSWSHTSLKHWLKIFDSPSKNTREKEKEKEKKKGKCKAFCVTRKHKNIKKF